MNYNRKPKLSLRFKAIMEAKIIGKADPKDAGIAIKISAIGLLIMFACFGIGFIVLMGNLEAIIKALYH